MTLSIGASRIYCILQWKSMAVSQVTGFPNEVMKPTFPERLRFRERAGLPGGAGRIYRHAGQAVAGSARALHGMSMTLHASIPIGS